MELLKIITYTPTENAEAMRQAMGDAGAGVIGDYSHCSFSVRGIGRFIPGENAHPAIGVVGKAEEVEEEMISMVCAPEVVSAVVAAIKECHPYEEPPIEIMKLEHC